jgi:hypothetical protein
MPLLQPYPNASESPGASRPAAPGACPTNGQPGVAVNTLTLKALLALPLTVVRATEYRFCRAPDCPTVYYSADGSQLFAEPDLRERVFQKHAAEPATPVCYCFQHTLGSIRDEIARTGASSVVEQIEAGIQADQCACDIRNPQGTCCLGNVRQLVRQLMAARRAQDGAPEQGKLGL